MAGELDALRRRQREAATHYCEVFMDGVLGEAQRLAPIEEGTLRGSADRETEQRPDGVDVVGSFSTIYAARQHEEVGWRHPKAGQAKYLEAPFKARLPTFERGLAAALARVTPR